MVTGALRFLGLAGKFTVEEFVERVGLFEAGFLGKVGEHWGGPMLSELGSSPNVCRRTCRKPS